MQNLLMLVGRVMLAAMMFWTGYGRLMSFASIHNYVNDWGVPHAFKPVIVLWEVGAGLLLLVGVYTKPAAYAAALFCVVSGFVVHLHDGDELQLIDFMKNMALTGGFLYVAAFGAGDWSFGKRHNIKWS
ncbi:MAG TPA: DoxX family protein [Gammaproteobacteria bacterium]|nr:DoxX family protein [Gammaproteobacteria bacterium]